VSAAQWHDRDEPVPPAWADDEGAEPEPDEDILAPVEGRCERCGRAAIERLCEACMRADRDAARQVAAPSVSYDFSARLEAIRREYEASPHRCTCGAKMMRELRPGELCDDCTEKQKDIRAHQAIVRMTVAALPERYRWASFDAPELAARVHDARAIAETRAAISNPNIDRVVFSGTAGSGKTSLACAAMRMLAETRQLQGAYCSARPLAFARSRGKLGEGEPALIINAIEAASLALDDVGLDPAQQFGSAVVDVLWERFDHMRFTVVCLSIPIEQVAEIYGGGVSRRLLDPRDPCLALIEVRP